MPLPPGEYGDSQILQVIKTTARDLMQAFTVEGGTDLVWEDVKSWNIHNRLSVPVSEYPAVFFVIPRVREIGFAIQRKRLWEVSLQIEFYFWEYEDEQDEEVAMWWIEEVSRLARITPDMTNPNPTKFKVEDWTCDGADIDYFTDGSQLLLGVICATTVKILDCRGGG